MVSVCMFVLFEAFDADFVTIAAVDEHDRDLVFVAIYAPIDCPLMDNSSHVSFQYTQQSLHML